MKRSEQAEYYIDKLNLELHPQGGYFRRSYCHKQRVKGECLPENISGERNLASAIYYLLMVMGFHNFTVLKAMRLGTIIKEHRHLIFG